MFAATFLIIGAHGLFTGLADPEALLPGYRALVPQFEWNSDWIIVAVSARFTIVCIPVVAVWWARSRVARMIVTGFTALAFLGIDPDTVARALLLAAGCAMLYLPSADRWLRGHRRENFRQFAPGEGTN